jgi:1-acyl-sn-glycerol-3-phosphate acyltransferase
VQKLREGEYIAILPEAGVSRSFQVRECKTGAVRMAAEAGVPIIPVSVWGAHRIMTRHHGFSPLRAWRAPVRVHVGETLTRPRGWTSRRPPRRCAKSSSAGSTPASRTSP